MTGALSMTFSTRQKKSFKWLLAILLSIPVLVFATYYIAEWRFKDIMKFVVETGSGGAYAFDATKTKLSLENRTVLLENVMLVSKDTLHTSPHYDVRIPQVYLAIKSWKQLIFQGKLFVDSLSITLPSIKSHDHGEKPSSTQVTFQISKIAQILEAAMEHLQVRSFSLKNGSFDYHAGKNAVPFVSNQINLNLRNFSKKAENDGRLFGSDEVDLNIENQFWRLPNGKNEISFKRLHFSGSNQFFELDSCLFRLKDSSGNGITIKAEKIFFNSRQLTAAYEKEELLIDTLLLYRPIIDFRANRKKKSTDDAKTTDNAIKELFNEIRFKYINIQDGEIIQNDNLGEPIPTSKQSTNLKIYNLALDPQTSKMTTDSINLKLKNTRLITRDSMFQLNIGEFSLLNKEVLLSSIEFGPTTINQDLKGIVFKAPVLSLGNININELVNKRLVGTDAELINPEITLFDKRNSQTIQKSRSKPTGGIDQFFKTLHGLGELIAVDNFNVVNGHMRYRSSAGPAPVAVDLKNMNLVLLLNKFFVSDSLIDIKRSMPLFTIQDANISAGDLKLRIHDFIFEGFFRHSHARDFTLSPGSGTTLKGNDLYWEILDWDLLQKYKLIQIEYIRLGKLDVSTTGEKRVNKKAPKDLPQINIARIDINKIHFNNSNPHKNSNLLFDAKDICISDIHSKNSFLTWEETDGVITNFSLKNPTTNASIERISFNNQYESVLQNTSVDIIQRQGVQRSCGYPAQY